MKIQVRYNRSLRDRVIVFYKGERMGEARELNLVANDRPPKRDQGDLFNNA